MLHILTHVLHILHYVCVSYMSLWVVKRCFLLQGWQVPFGNEKLRELFFLAGCRPERTWKSMPGPPNNALCIFAYPLQNPHACQPFWNCYRETLTCSSLLAARRMHLPHKTTLQHPKVARTSRCVLCVLASKRASRHRDVQILISHLARRLCTRHFSKPTFRPSKPQILGETRGFATFLPFRAPVSSFFNSSLTFPTSAFSPVHIVGSLTSKLPSTFVDMSH